MISSVQTKSARKKADYGLFVIFAIWLAIGLVALTSASSPLGRQQFGDGYFFIKKQLLYGVLPGLALFFFLSKINCLFWKKTAVLVFAFALSLLVLVFIPGIGNDYGTGTNSWLNVAGFSVQPSEFAKPALIIFLAWFLSKQGKNIKDFWRGFFPAVALGSLPIILVTAQPDIGTVSILFAILIGLLFSSEAKISHLFLLLAVSAAALTIMIFAAPYRTARLMVFLHPELDPQGQGYHIDQAYLSIGSGGIFGLGLGHSRQKFQYLPEAHSDSVFAVFSEEMGFLVVTAFMFFLILAAKRIFGTAKRSEDQFGRFLAVGVGVWLFFQSFLNIGAMVGIMPLTGVPLPFVSHGGTAMMSALAGAGLIVAVSRKEQ